MVHGSFEDRLHNWDDLPRVDVGSEQLEAKLSEWIELARLHIGEPVVTYSKKSFWPYHMGKVIGELDQLPEFNILQGMAITENSTIESSGHQVRDSDYPVRLGIMEAYNFSNVLRLTSGRLMECRAFR